MLSFSLNISLNGNYLRRAAEQSLYCFLQEVLDRASTLCREGEGLIQNSHYAEDSIQPKCSELRETSEDVSCRLKAKKEYLLKAMELHHRLEKARRHKNTSIFHQIGSIFVISSSSALLSRHLNGLMMAFTC